MPTETEIYAEIGRRYVQIVRLQNYVEQAIDGTLDFAASPVKEKKCTPGKSHFCRTPEGKGSCVSVKKQCKYKPDGAVKVAADYVQKTVLKPQTAASARSNDESGGALADTGGKLTKSKSALNRSTATSQQDKSPSKQPTATDKIDQKYASDKPTETNIDGWIKDQLAYHTSAEGLTLRDSIKKRYRPSGSEYWADAPDGIRRATGDKKAYLDQVAKELHDDNLKKKADGIDYGDWRRYAFPGVDKAIADTKAKIANPKTSASAKAKLEKQLKRQEEEKATAEAAAKRMADRLNLSQSDLRKKLEDEFNANQASQETTAKKLQAQIAKGNQKVIQQQLEEVLGFRTEYASPDKGEVPAATQNRQRGTIRKLLRNAVQPTAAREVLDVPEDATPAQIKAAYRKASLRTHPDAGGTPEEFERVNNAYNKLRKELDFSEVLDDWWYSFEVLDIADLTSGLRYWS